MVAVYQGVVWGRVLCFVNRIALYLDFSGNYISHLVLFKNKSFLEILFPYSYNSLKAHNSVVFRIFRVVQSFYVISVWFCCQARLKDSTGNKTAPYFSPFLPSFSNYYVYLLALCLMNDTELEIPLGILCKSSIHPHGRLCLFFLLSLGFLSVSLVISFIYFMSFGNTSQFKFKYDSCFSMLCFIILFWMLLALF